MGVWARYKLARRLSAEAALVSWSSGYCYGFPYSARFGKFVVVESQIIPFGVK
jgi:hypothetical protein